LEEDYKILEGCCMTRADIKNLMDLALGGEIGTDEQRKAAREAAEELEIISKLN
jgi:hypothetical protein